LKSFFRASTPGSGMLCECGSDTKVVDSRTERDAIRRRRECLECSKRFSTLEKKVESKVRAVPEPVVEKPKPIKAKVIQQAPARTPRWDEDDDASDISDTRYGGTIFRRNEWD